MGKCSFLSFVTEIFVLSFYRLDLGNGKNLDLEQCRRSKLRKQCIKYLGPVCTSANWIYYSLFNHCSWRWLYWFVLHYFKSRACSWFSDLLACLNIFLNQQERENYEYIVCEGKIIHKQSGYFLHTNKDSEDAKWIFVMSTSKKLYAGKVTIQTKLLFLISSFLVYIHALLYWYVVMTFQKKKGLFHHSSFLAGGATLAAGRLEAEHGILKVKLRSQVAWLNWEKAYLKWESKGYPFII